MPTATEQKNGAAMVAESLKDYYCSRRLVQQTPHCMRNYWPALVQHKSMWKIDRGRRSEREMLSARAHLRNPISNSAAILRMKEYNGVSRKPKGSI